MSITPPCINPIFFSEGKMAKPSLSHNVGSYSVKPFPWRSYIFFIYGYRGAATHIPVLRENVQNPPTQLLFISFWVRENLTKTLTAIITTGNILQQPLCRWLRIFLLVRGHSHARTILRENVKNPHTQLLFIPFWVRENLTKTLTVARIWGKLCKNPILGEPYIFFLGWENMQNPYHRWGKMIKPSRHSLLWAKSQPLDYKTHRHRMATGQTLSW